MKLLFMADVDPEPDSGAAGTEYQTVRALENLGVEVETVWSEDLSHYIQHGNLHYLLELPASLRREMGRRLRSSHYDVIHVNQPHGYLAAKDLKKIKRNTVFIHRSHGFELRVKRDLASWNDRFSKDDRSIVRRSASMIMGHLLSRHSRQIAEYADGHIVSATECKEYLVRKMGVLPDRVAVIPQAPPDSFLQGDIKPVDPARLSKILYVGQYAFVKAPMVLARVFSKLAAARNDLEFTWVCAKQHHDEARALLDPGARDRVRFLDWLPQKELSEVYDQHGIFLFPSFFEGFGKAFIEAMSRGLCVVAADNGGMRDVIRHGVSGFLVSTGDNAGMTAACLDLLENPRKALAISREAIHTARKYSWQRVGRETVDFYNKLLLEKRLSEQKLIGPFRR